MAIVPCPIPKIQFFNNNGKPAAGGYLYTYKAGAPNLPKATCADSTGTVLNPTPIVLDEGGRASIWLDGAYYMALWTGDREVEGSSLIWSQDNVGDPRTAPTPEPPVPPASKYLYPMSHLINVDPNVYSCTYHIRKINNQIWVFDDYSFVADVGYDYRATITRFTIDTNEYIDRTRVELDTNKAWRYGGYSLVETETDCWLFGAANIDDGVIVKVSKTDPTIQTYYPLVSDIWNYYSTLPFAYASTDPDLVWIYGIVYVDGQPIATLNQWSLTTQEFTGVVITLGLFMSFGGQFNTLGMNTLTQLNSNELVYVYCDVYSVNKVCFADLSSNITEVMIPTPRGMVENYINCIVKTNDADTIWVLTEHLLVKVNTATKSIVATYAVPNYASGHTGTPTSMGYDSEKNVLFWLSDMQSYNYPLLVIFDLETETVQSRSVMPTGFTTDEYSRDGFGDYAYELSVIDGDWWFGGYLYMPDIDPTYDGGYSVYKITVETGDSPVPVLLDNFSDYWTAASCTSSGGKLLAGTGNISNNDNLYISTNSGAQWTTRLIGVRYDSYYGGWYGAASSADGSILLAANYGNYAYLSVDGGTTWKICLGAGVDDWTSTAVGVEGATVKLFACADWNPAIYTSTDLGETWTPRNDEGNYVWAKIACSEDGTIVTAAAYAGEIHLSNDSGVTWRIVTELGVNTSGTAISSDGTAIIALHDHATAFISRDSGITWVEQTSIIPTTYYSYPIAAFSADGNKVVVVLYNTSYLLIGDYDPDTNAYVWTQIEVGSKYWQSVSCSADGTKLYAAVYDDYIYHSFDGGVTWGYTYE